MVRIKCFAVPAITLSYVIGNLHWPLLPYDAIGSVSLKPFPLLKSIFGEHTVNISYIHSKNQVTKFCTGWQFTTLLIGFVFSKLVCLETWTLWKTPGLKEFANFTICCFTLAFRSNHDCELHIATDRKTLRECSLIIHRGDGKIFPKKILKNYSWKFLWNKEKKLPSPKRWKKLTPCRKDGKKITPLWIDNIALLFEYVPTFNRLRLLTRGSVCALNFEFELALTSSKFLYI